MTTLEFYSDNQSEQINGGGIKCQLREIKSFAKILQSNSKFLRGICKTEITQTNCVIVRPASMHT